MLEQLGVDGWKLAIQAFNFLLLLLILQRFAYRPLVGMLDARAARIRNDLDEARRLREEGERDRETYRQQLNRARDEARSILEEANNVAARIREQAIIDAEQQNAVTLQRARDEIVREKEHAIAELRREVGDLAIRVASQVVGRSLDGGDQRRLVDEALAQVQTNTN
ncbi:MAG TPA: F0F1 ATP synthase subunit B [Chloroflexota bacterium]|nr:F0F1 ATP synthase subunit B [Chloroflexota bacterium]